MAYQRVSEAFKAVPITSSTNVMPAPGVIQGYRVTSFTSGATITIYDDVATGTGILLFATEAISSVGYQPLTARCRNGCYVAISGTASITMLVNADGDY